MTGFAFILSMIHKLTNHPDHPDNAHQMIHMFMRHKDMAHVHPVISGMFQLMKDRTAAASIQFYGLYNDAFPFSLWFCSFSVVLRFNVADYSLPAAFRLIRRDMFVRSRHAMHQMRSESLFRRPPQSFSVRSKRG